jgi:hypothetical protein
MPTRRLYFHGFLIVLISLALGLVVAAVGPGPAGRLWLASHTTGLMTGLMVVAAGVVWSELTLSERALKAAYFCITSGAWAGVIFLGVFVPIMKMPQGQAGHELPPVSGWPMAVVGVSLVYVTLTLLAGATLVVIGLRTKK